MPPTLYKRPKEPAFVPEFEKERRETRKHPDIEKHLQSVVKGLKSVKVGK